MLCELVLKFSYLLLSERSSFFSGFHREIELKTAVIEIWKKKKIFVETHSSRVDSLPQLFGPVSFQYSDIYHSNQQLIKYVMLIKYYFISPIRQDFATFQENIVCFTSKVLILFHFLILLVQPVLLSCTTVGRTI